MFEPRNTMKLGAQLPWALETADQSFCHTAGLHWDAAAALAPWAHVHTAGEITTLVEQVCAAAQAVITLSV